MTVPSLRSARLWKPPAARATTAAGPPGAAGSPASLSAPAGPSLWPASTAPQASTVPSLRSTMLWAAEEIARTLDNPAGITVSPQVLRPQATTVFGVAAVLTGGWIAATDASSSAPKRTPARARKRERRPAGRDDERSI